VISIILMPKSAHSTRALFFEESGQWMAGFALPARMAGKNKGAMRPFMEYKAWRESVLAAGS
jgi:hypothetical protein